MVGNGKKQICKFHKILGEKTSAILTRRHNFTHLNYTKIPIVGIYEVQEARFIPDPQLVCMVGHTHRVFCKLNS